MRSIFARAPTLAWMLVALTCFLAGMAVVEGRHQSILLPVVPPVGVVVTVEVAVRSVALPDSAATATARAGSEDREPNLAEGIPHPEP